MKRAVKSDSEEAVRFGGFDRREKSRRRNFEGRPNVVGVVDGRQVANS